MAGPDDAEPAAAGRAPEDDGGRVGATATGTPVEPAACDTSGTTAVTVAGAVARTDGAAGAVAAGVEEGGATTAGEDAAATSGALGGSALWDAGTGRAPPPRPPMGTMPARTRSSGRMGPAGVRLGGGAIATAAKGLEMAVARAMDDGHRPTCGAAHVSVPPYPVSPPPPPAHTRWRWCFCSRTRALRGGQRWLHRPRPRRCLDRCCDPVRRLHAHAHRARTQNAGRTYSRCAAVAVLGAGAGARVPAEAASEAVSGTDAATGADTGTSTGTDGAGAGAGLSHLGARTVARSMAASAAVVSPARASQARCFALAVPLCRRCSPQRAAVTRRREGKKGRRARDRRDRC